MEGDVVLNAEPPVRAGVGTEVDGLERPRPRRTPCDAAAAGPSRRRARVGRRATGTGADTAAGSVGRRLGGRREEWGCAGWAGTGNGSAVWAAGQGKEKGEEGDFGPWERKEKEGRRGKRWAGWAERERGKRKAFLFLKGFKHIQFKFEFKNSNSN